MDNYQLNKMTKGVKDVPEASPEKTAEVNGYISKTFIWLFIGLIETFGLAIYSAKTNMFETFLKDAPELALVFLIAYLLLGIFMMWFIRKIPYAISLIMYFVFNAAQGIALGVTLQSYEVGSVVYVFAVTAVLFGIMGIWGLTTKRDLTHWGTALFFALVGLIALSIIGYFLHMSAYEYVISFIGVIIFVLNTAYDTQRIKKYFLYNSVYHQGDDKELEVLNRGTVVGAFTLLLNFINIFLRLLTLLGKQKD